jgi:hypothetical protein
MVECPICKFDKPCLDEKIGAELVCTACYSNYKDAKLSDMNKMVERSIAKGD